MNLSVMIKPASSLCNLRCKYCFYHSLAESRENYDFGVMDFATADKLISSALDFCNGDSVTFAFQGGEPLIAGLEYFRHFTEEVKRKNTAGAKVYYGLQTNGTLITLEWAEFFKANNFLIGLSLDGDQKANRNRIDAHGNFTYGRVMEASKILSEYGVEYNILCVLTAYIAKNIEHIYSFYKSKGFKYLQFIPCLRPFGSTDENQLFMTPEVYANYLIRAFNLYVKDYVAGNYTSIRQFDNYVFMYLGRAPEQCGMCGHCSHQFIIEANGNVYPCDFYCLDEWLLGNINEKSFSELAHCELATKFLKESLYVPEDCKHCPYYPLCRAGGCKRSRADRDYCASYKAFFHACLPLFSVFRGEKRF